MTPETPGQRIARELEEALNAGKGYGLIDAINVAIDACTELLEAEARHAALVIVRRERAQALREAADAYWRDMAHSTIVTDWLRARAAEEEGHE